MRTDTDDSYITALLLVAIFVIAKTIIFLKVLLFRPILPQSGPGLFSELCFLNVKNTPDFYRLLQGFALEFARHPLFFGGRMIGSVVRFSISKTVRPMCLGEHCYTVVSKRNLTE